MSVDYAISEETSLGSILPGAIHKVCMHIRRGVVELKGYIYCFGNILLLKYVQGEKGVQKFGLSKFTCFTDIIKKRLSS